MNHWTGAPGISRRHDKARARAEKLRAEADRLDAKADLLYAEYLKATAETRRKLGMAEP